MDYVKEIGLPALYENLAEECLELAHECLKMARILRKESPTPKTVQDVAPCITEEVSDVILDMALLHLKPDEKIMDEKLKRLDTRILQTNYCACKKNTQK